MQRFTAASVSFKTAAASMSPSKKMFAGGGNCYAPSSYSSLRCFSSLRFRQTAMLSRAQGSSSAMSGVNGAGSATTGVASTAGCTPGKPTPMTMSLRFQSESAAGASPGTPLSGDHKAAAAWLLGSGCILLSVMIIGGVTRIYARSMSSVNCRPLGVAPPKDDKEWQAAFNTYKSSYEQLNGAAPDATLDEFKKLVYLEFSHHLLSRVFALVYAIPLGVFLARGTFKQRPAIAGVALGVLGLELAQGVHGILMMEKDKVTPSNSVDTRKQRKAFDIYSLLVHNALALVVFASVLRLGLGVTLPAAPAFEHRARMQFFARASLAAMSLTAVIGSPVASLNAGLLYSDTFPWMAGRIIPPSEELFLRDLPWYRNLGENGVCAQTLHRIMAGVTFLTLCGANSAMHRSKKPKPPKTVMNAMMYVNVSLILQLLLGIRTLKTQVETHSAESHQFVSMLLFSSLVHLCAVIGTRGNILVA